MAESRDESHENQESTERHAEHILSLIESFETLVNSCPSHENQAQHILAPCRELTIKAFVCLVQKHEIIYHHDFEFYYQLKMASNQTHLDDNVRRLQTNLLPTLKNSIISLSGSLQLSDLKKEPILKMKKILLDLSELEDAMDEIRSSFYDISTELHEKLKDVCEPAHGLAQFKTQCLVWRVTNIRKYICCEFVQAGLDLVENLTFPNYNQTASTEDLLPYGDFKNVASVWTHSAASLDLVEQLDQWFQLPEWLIVQDCWKSMSTVVNKDWSKLLSEVNPDRFRCFKARLAREDAILEKRKQEVEKRKSEVNPSDKEELSSIQEEFTSIKQQRRIRPPTPSEELIKSTEFIAPIIKLGRLFINKLTNLISKEELFLLLWETHDSSSSEDSDHWISDVLEFLNDLPQRPHIESLRIRFGKLLNHDPDDPCTFVALVEPVSNIYEQYNTCLSHLTQKLDVIINRSTCPPHIRDKSIHFKEWCSTWDHQFFDASEKFDEACSTLTPPKYNRPPLPFPFPAFFFGAFGNQDLDSDDSDGGDGRDGSEEYTDESGNDDEEDSDGFEGSDGDEEDDEDGEDDEDKEDQGNMQSGSATQYEKNDATQHQTR